MWLGKKIIVPMLISLTKSRPIFWTVVTASQQSSIYQMLSKKQYSTKNNNDGKEMICER